MIIYYLAAFYPAKYKECVSANGISPAYKFNKLFAEGMANVAGTKVRCIVPRIILDKINDDDSRNRKIEVENGVEYIFLNAGRDSYVSFIKSALKELKNAKKEDNVTLICDALSVNNSLLCMMAKLRYKIRNVAIVTDLPQYVGDSNKRVLPKLFDKADLFLMKRFDKFVFLTEYMNQCLNKRCKPFCVMEDL